MRFGCDSDRFRSDDFNAAWLHQYENPTHKVKDAERTMIGRLRNLVGDFLTHLELGWDTRFTYTERTR